MPAPMPLPPPVTTATGASVLDTSTLDASTVSAAAAMLSKKSTRWKVNHLQFSCCSKLQALSERAFLDKGIHTRTVRTGTY